MNGLQGYLGTVGEGDDVEPRVVVLGCGYSACAMSRGDVHVSKVLLTMWFSIIDCVVSTSVAQRRCTLAFENATGVTTRGRGRGN